MGGGLGRLFVFEGPERVGKTTQVRAVARWLTEAGVSVTVVREPGGTPLGEHLRTLLLDGQVAPLPETEALLFAAARAELVGRVVRPALAAGHVVLADRFTLSSLAYQVYGRGLPRELVEAANRLATGDLQPDLTVVLLGEGFGRPGDDRLEREDRAFHERVRVGYAQLAERMPAARVVNADLPVEMVTARIRALIEPYLVRPPRE
ncbi:MAG: dTMP kinase [Actinomycetia bacterium]|nr:dTMP kinase [Actinomycetes bacterium]